MTGQIVSCNFPFSDLSAVKRRPAIVVAVAEFDDLVLCQITSKAYASNLAIELVAGDFKAGGLPQRSFIRPDKLFTASRNILDKHHGTVKEAKLRQVQGALSELFQIA